MLRENNLAKFYHLMTLLEILCGVHSEEEKLLSLMYALKYFVAA